MATGQRGEEKSSMRVRAQESKGVKEGTHRPEEKGQDKKGGRR